MPMQYSQIFKVLKNEISRRNFLIFFSKHKLWAHCLAEAVLMSTHNLCFGAKIRKIGIPLHTPVLLYKSGVILRTCFPDVTFLLPIFSENMFQENC